MQSGFAYSDFRAAAGCLPDVGSGPDARGRRLLALAMFRLGFAGLRRPRVLNRHTDIARLENLEPIQRAATRPSRPRRAAISSGVGCSRPSLALAYRLNLRTASFAGCSSYRRCRLSCSQAGTIQVGPAARDRSSGRAARGEGAAAGRRFRARLVRSRRLRPGVHRRRSESLASSTKCPAGSAADRRARHRNRWRTARRSRTRRRARGHRRRLARSCRLGAVAAPPSRPSRLSSLAK